MNESGQTLAGGFSVSEVDQRELGSEIKIVVVGGAWQTALETAVSHAKRELAALGGDYIPWFIPYPEENMIGVKCEKRFAG